MNKVRAGECDTPRLLLVQFLCGQILLCADFIWATRGRFTRSALQRVWLLVGGDNFARLRYLRITIGLQIIQQRLILLNQRTLIGRLKITQTLS